MENITNPKNILSIKKKRKLRSDIREIQEIGFHFLLGKMTSAPKDLNIWPKHFTFAPSYSENMVSQPKQKDILKAKGTPCILTMIQVT